jgi:hypothetical protein
MGQLPARCRPAGLPQTPAQIRLAQAQEKIKKPEAKKQSLFRAWAFVADEIFDRSFEALSPRAIENGTGQPASDCTDIASSNHNMATALNKIYCRQCQSNLQEFVPTKNLSSLSVA